MLAAAAGRRRTPGPRPLRHSVTPLKAAVLVLLMLPALHLAQRALAGGLGARPVSEAIHVSGLWAVRLVLIALAVSPARRLLAWPRIITVRRMTGVAAFAYAALHLALYALDQDFVAWRIGREIVTRYYLTIGAVALLGLAALAATSFDAAIRRLGPARWRRLHRLTYPVAVLAVAHFFMQSRADVSEPTLMAGLLLWLLAYRLMLTRLHEVRWVELLALALGSALATAALELGWYGLATGIDPWRVMAAYLHPGLGPRPAFLVLVAGLAVVAARWVRALTRAMPGGRRGSVVEPHRVLVAQRRTQADLDQP